MSKKLNSQDRLKLYRYRRLGLGVRAIARELGRAPSTISRELERYKGVVCKNDDYHTQAHRAQAEAHARRVAGSRKKMRLKSKEIREYVEKQLSLGLTPELIAGRLSLDHPGLSISTEAIYQWLLKERADLRAHLPVAGKARRRRRAGRQRRLPQPAAPKRSIEERPAVVNERRRIGDFEYDTIVSSRKGSAVILTIADRKTRRVFLSKLPKLDSKQCSAKVVERLREVPREHRHTLTSDNGPENALHDVVDRELRTTSYFCHPHCAPERGAVENRNRAVRIYFPKGTNFDDVPEEYIEYAETLLNNRPMKVLGFKTPHEAWLEALAA